MLVSWTIRTIRKNRTDFVSPGRGYPCAIVIEAVGQCLGEILLDGSGGWVGGGRRRRLAGSDVQLHHSRNQERIWKC